MIIDILVLFFVVIVLLTVCASVAGARTTAAVTPITTAAPKAKAQRPLWAEVPMPESVPPRCTAWENQWASKDTRLEREAEVGKGRPLPRFTPSPELPPQRKFHRPLKAKGRNWA